MAGDRTTPANKASLADGWAVYIIKLSMRQTDKTPHSVLEKMKEAENFSCSMNFGHFSIQVGISPSEVISAQKMKWAVKLWSSGYALSKFLSKNLFPLAGKTRIFRGR